MIKWIKEIWRDLRSVPPVEPPQPHRPLGKITVKKPEGLWDGAFALPENGDGFRYDNSKEKLNRSLPYMPADVTDTGPTPAESQHLNLLYDISDRPGRLPTNHWYLYVDGEAVAVVTNMKVDNEGDGIHFTNAPRLLAAYRKHYPDKELPGATYPEWTDDRHRPEWKNII